MFNNPLEELSLSAARRQSYRPAAEALEERVAPAAVTRAVLLEQQEVLTAERNLRSLQLNPTRHQAVVVLANERRVETQHLRAHQLDQSLTARGVNDAPFQRLDARFHVLDARAVARADRIQARG
jgi:hypothetical protein